MAVSLGWSTTPPSSVMPSPPPSPRRSSSQASLTGCSRSSGNPSQKIELGDYILGPTLGEGEFGKVKLGWRRPEPGELTGDGAQVSSALFHLLLPLCCCRVLMCRSPSNWFERRTLKSKAAWGRLTEKLKYWDEYIIQTLWNYATSNIPTDTLALSSNMQAVGNCSATSSPIVIWRTM